jgi:molecular chaperone DnaK (HSP70)
MHNKIFPVDESSGFLPEKNVVCTGIDLGTTYTLMATVDSMEVDFSKSNRIPVKFISVPQHSPLEYDPVITDEKVASMVALVNGKPYVGNNLYHLKGRDGFVYKRNMFYHWKVEMGVEHFPMYPNAVSDKLDMPFKIASGILNYIRTHYLNDPKQELENTIVTVPASFQINQRQDVLKACKLGKIKTSEKMLIDEPNAAFLGYFNRLDEQEKQDWANNVRNKNVLVIDFGGGTLDLSILNVDFKSDKGIAIANRAISRYNDLGGQDIDSLIAEEYLYPVLKEKYSAIESISHKDLQNSVLPQLAIHAEKLKIAISNALSLKAVDEDVEDINFENITVEVDDCSVEFNGELYDLGTVSINGEKFKELFMKIFRGRFFDFKLQDKTVTTISHSITEIIEKSNLTLDAINYVLFVGGSSFNPFLISQVKQKLTKAEALTTPEPDKLVAEGAAVFSYFYYVHGISLINPITSDTIGIVLKGNTFFPLIERGTQLPVEVELPEFKMQSNLSNEIVVPVCINDVDFPIGEIRASLNSFYTNDDVVTIKASVTEDKVFDLKVYIDGEFIDEGDFDNPFSIGKVSQEELELMQYQRKMSKAKFKNNTRDEKRLLRKLIWKHSDVGNNAGIVETAEEYIRRFDDQDPWVWNMVYIGNSNMGKNRAAEKALKKAMELSPDNPSFVYNYSLLVEQRSPQEALDFLEKQNDYVSKDNHITCKKVMLKKDLGMNCKEEAKEIVESYKNKTSYFSDFEKRVLLPKVFRIAGEKYSYVDPKKNRNKKDEEKYLESRGTVKRS